MKVGIENIAESGLYGMPSSHITALVNANKDYVISFRPVSSFALTPLLAGFPTKPFLVKNKSSKLGPIAGFIAINATYSRAITPEEATRHNEQIQHIMDIDQSFRSIPLTIDHSRIIELGLLCCNHLTIQPEPTAQSELYQFTWQKDNQSLQVFAVKIPGSEQYIIAENKDGTTPIQVLGKSVIIDDREVLNPITADYDLLVICHPYQIVDMQKKDQPTFKVQGNPQKNIKEVLQPSHPDLKMDAKKGNISPRTSDVIDELNRIILQTDARRTSPELCVIHHGQEMHNPFSDKIEDDFPCLFILPKNIIGFLQIKNTTIDLSKENNRVLLLENIEEMKELRNLLINEVNGFYWPMHPKYMNYMSPFKRKSYESCNAFIVRHLDNVKKRKLENTDDIQVSKIETPSDVTQQQNLLDTQNYNDEYLFKKLKTDGNTSETQQSQDKADVNERLIRRTPSSQ